MAPNEGTKLRRSDSYAATRPTSGDSGRKQKMRFALTTHYGVDIYTPYMELPEHFKNVLLYGSGKEEITFYFEQNNRRFSYKKTYEGV